ncbi:MAG: phosphatidate cytidylyltransferase [Actinobacteria bacterium]|nr:phosphatidate cytidylyltransferase [Actinomycetota bacterium]
MNLKSFAIRSLVALVFAPLIIFAALVGGPFWLALILVIVLFSIREYMIMAQNKNAFVQLPVAAVAGIFIIISFYQNKPSQLIPILLLTLIVSFFIELYRKKESSTLNTAVTLFSALYFSLLFGSFILIRELPGNIGISYRSGGEWIVMMILATWVCDTAAYVFGSYFGKHKLIERISPNKSVEGTAAGFIFAILTAYLCHIWFIHDLSLTNSLVIGFITGSFGQYGDLFESMIKRDVGVKDSSNLIPGHGGMMDRFDSLTISAPLVFLYLKFLVF